jgi:hypothetical protein
VPRDLEAFPDFTRRRTFLMFRRRSLTDTVGRGALSGVGSADMRHSLP